MEHGQILLRKERPAVLLALGSRFFLAAALTAARTEGGYAPVALGLVSAAGAGTGGAAAFAGTAVGALVFLDFAHALPHLAVAVLILTAASAFRGSRLLGSERTAALTAALLFLMVGGVYALQSLEPLEALPECMAAAALTGVSAWMLRPVLAQERRDRFGEGTLFLAAALLLTLAPLEVLGVSPGRSCMCLLLLWAACDRGTVFGVSMGLGLGLTLDLCMGSGAFTAALGLGGLLAGRRQGRRRGSVGGAFLLGVSAAVLLSRDPYALPLLMESAVGSAAFLLLPGRVFGGKRLQRPELPEAKSSALRDRLDRAAAALRDLYDSMNRSGAPQTEENPAVVFDRAAERVCRGCALRDLCWQKEYTSTFNAMNDATPFLLERGRALAKDFPQYFSSRCIHLQELIAAINTELSAFLLRRQYRRQLEETRRSARGQYAQMSELLSAAAAGLEAVQAFGGEGPECPIGAVLRPRKGETVCGDTVTSFRREDGALCLLLADGMGSGEAARRESALTCRLLQQFLEAGIEPEAALKTLNSAMALRGAETGSFTTVDLCVVKPVGGEVSFYKYGAAPSYLKRGGLVRRVAGNSLPVGMRGTPAPPDVTRTRLEEDSFVILVSDGVADPLRDEWLQDLLAGWQGEDPQALAALILAESVRREGLQDDCGVQVLYRGRDEGKMV